jgi:transcriptional regulator of arginine metabolism
VTLTLEELVISIIKQESIPDQKTLLHRIAQAGYSIDQSTLSRLLKKVGAEKNLGKYTLKENRPAPFLKIHQVDIVPPNLIIVKTRSGHAKALTTLIDQARIEGIAGTLAGDDNIFIAVYPLWDLEKIKRQIEEIAEDI